MDPASRKAWLASAMAILKDRKGLTQTAIAEAMGKSRQNFGQAIAKERPSMKFLEAMREAYPDLPDFDQPVNTKADMPPTNADMEAAVDRLERSMAGLLAQNAMIMARLEEALKNKG